MRSTFYIMIALAFCNSCLSKADYSIEVFETSESGNKLTKISEFDKSADNVDVVLKPDEKFQKITGFGGCPPADHEFLVPLCQ
jgi:glucosylceramidase